MLVVVVLASCYYNKFWRQSAYKEKRFPSSHGVRGVLWFLALFGSSAETAQYSKNKGEHRATASQPRARGRGTLPFKGTP